MPIELVYLLFTPVLYLLSWKLGQLRWRAQENDATLYRAIVDSAVDAAILVHDVDQDNRVVHASPAACRFLGLNQGELMAATPDRWDPHSFPEGEPGPSLPEDGSPLRYETKYRTAAGEQVPVEVSLSRVSLPRRNLILSISRDLRPQHEMALRARRLEMRALEMRLERSYKEIYDNLVDGIFLLDVTPDGRFVIAGYNRQAEASLGIPEAEAVGKTKEELFSPELAAKLTELDRQCVAGGVPLHYSDMLDLPAGRIYVDNTLIPLRDGSGRIHRIVGISRDVTERRRVELAEHVRMQQYRLLVEQSPDPIARFDREARRVYANAKLAELSGQGAPLLWTTPTEFPGGESSVVYEERVREVLATGEDVEFELGWSNTDAAPRYTQVRLSAERDTAGRVNGVIAIGRDITERKRREVQEAARAEVFELLSGGADLPDVLGKVVSFAESAWSGMVGCILLPPVLVAGLDRVVGPKLPAGLREFLENVESGPMREECCLDVRHGEPVFKSDLADQESCAGCPARAVAVGLSACWSMPIVGALGEVLGTFVFYQERAGLPDEQGMAQMEQARQLARLVIERWRAEAHIRRQADYDSLTGLPNRNLLRDRLADMMCYTDRLALLYVDLDNFKEVNDSLGHRQGDRMLEEVAQRLRDCIPENELVARMSGDEFMVVLSEKEGEEYALQMAENVRQALAGDYTLGHGKVWGSASIGVARFPEQTRDLDELLSHADQAMYAAKLEGRNCWRSFSQAMLDRTHARLRLATDLRLALERGELAVHYQPIVDLVSGRMLKAEALLRWTHPELGPVSPVQFIPLAEETGLIQEIGDWVFRQAARVAMEWNRLAWGATGGLRRIAVNRSPRQFFTEEGVDGWLAYLDDNGIPGEMLGVEITEGLLLDDRPEVTHQLAALRGAGITISLDDFGTGYSALSYLKKFDIDFLKIDRSFVLDIETDPDSRAIVESIIAMARRLGMKLIAEGVETQEQAQMLSAAECHFAQGYLYARPLPESEFLAQVARR